MGQSKRLLSPIEHSPIQNFSALIDNRQCAGSEHEVRQRIDALNDQWEGLLAKSNEKTQKLKEANQQQLFNTGVKDIDFWLGEVWYTLRRIQKYFSIFLFRSKLCSLQKTMEKTWTVYKICLKSINLSRLI